MTDAAETLRDLRTGLDFSPEEFDALRADFTVLAGSVVYDSTSGEGAADWFREFDAQLEEVFSEVGTEE